MKRILSLFAAAAVVTGLLCVFGSAGAYFCKGTADEWNVLGSCGLVASELQRQEHLESANSTVRQRCEYKHEVSRALIEGRMTLPEALERFRQVNEQYTESMPEAADGPGMADDALYQSLLGWVEAELGDQPAELEAVKARLALERHAAE